MSDEGSQEFLRPYFTNLKLIGTGGSGAVYSGIDSKTDRRVALKRVNIQDQSSCRTTLRQIEVQRNLEHENIVKLLNIVDCEGKSIHNGDAENFKDTDYVYLVQEVMETNLHTILQSNSSLGQDYSKLFLYQLLRGLKYIHSANVLHRDIKPSNLLVDSETLMLKIGDFGQTRVVDPEFDHDGYLTHSPSTLWYKAPELFLNSTGYSNAIDIWGAGCVFAEMLLGKPLFEGRHDIEQLQLILDTIPVDSKGLNNLEFDMKANFDKMLLDGPKEPLYSKFQDLDPKALDLLKQMLRFSPESRITAEDALTHPYLGLYSFPEDEPISLAPLHIEDEVDDFSEDILRELMLDEIIRWRSRDEESIDKESESVEKDIMSLKELMSSQDEPLTLDISMSGIYRDDPIAKYKLHPEVKEALGLHSSKEGLDTLAAAVKISRTFNGESDKKYNEEHEGSKNDKPQLRAGMSKVMESVLGKDYKKNFDLTCKAGPLGLCYL